MKIKRSNRNVIEAWRLGTSAKNSAGTFFTRDGKIYSFGKLVGTTVGSHRYWLANPSAGKVGARRQHSILVRTASHRAVRPNAEGNFPSLAWIKQTLDGLSLVFVLAWYYPEREVYTPTEQRRSFENGWSSYNPDFTVAAIRSARLATHENLTALDIENKGE